ncbi:peptidoglycan-binding protein [Bacillus methanolicus]|nr:peptidoglycan-binding protein [Bacillus methanolicus]
MLELKKVNNKSTNELRIGERLVIPESITPYEKDLLARLVHAEAKGEPYAGKVTVATVVLNRVDHPDFPNTIRDVIYEVSGGSYAFTPVQNGTINEPADAESFRAVNEALDFRELGNGSVYFYNPDKITSLWVLSRNVMLTIGNHVFAK